MLLSDGSKRKARQIKTMSLPAGLAFTEVWLSPSCFSTGPWTRWIVSDTYSSGCDVPPAGIELVWGRSVSKVEWPNRTYLIQVSVTKFGGGAEIPFWRFLNGVKTIVLSKPESFVICSGLSLVFMKTVMREKERERKREREEMERKRKKKKTKVTVSFLGGCGTWSYLSFTLFTEVDKDFEAFKSKVHIGFILSG